MIIIQLRISTQTTYIYADTFLNVQSSVESIEMGSREEERYRSVNLPIGMVEEVDRLIERFSEHGYSSRADFIKQAVREKILELEALETARGTERTQVFK